MPEKALTLLSPIQFVKGFGLVRIKALSKLEINTVGQFEPRIELLEVDVNDLPGDNAFNVTINYRIVGVPLVETVAFVLQRPE